MHGLIQLEVDFYKVSDQSVNASQIELDIFLRIWIKWIVDAVCQGLVKLHVSDRIHVVAGLFQGLTGRVIDIKEHHMIIFKSDELFSMQRVRTWEIHKMFLLGDFVRVVCSEQKGVKCFIVNLDQTHAFIYRCFGQTTNQESCQDIGSEISKWLQVVINSNKTILYSSRLT